MIDHRFQVDLRAIIELLSSNLYSGPQVFLRELLQNAADAIRARKALDPNLEGQIDLELVRSEDGSVTLVVEDNGVGLTPDEVHQFLATIGSSSKREAALEQRSDFIGQFGIGLLSCFIVTDEIVLLTRSARENTGAVEWRGKADGSYTLRELSGKMSPGAKVYIRCKPGSESFFRTEFVKEKAGHYGSLLPFPIRVMEGERHWPINVEAPWKRTHATQRERDTDFMAYGAKAFGIDFFDCISLRDAAFPLEGAAFILPYSPNLAASREHRIYLKDMLVTERADNLLPEWAFFVRCIVNTPSLRPTASRESLREDESLAKFREIIGEHLRDYLLRLVRFDSARLARFIGIHARSLKNLATHDDELLKMIADLLPFQTSLGDMTLQEARSRSAELFYVPDVDEYRQIAEIASAQGLCVINAGYVYDMELLERIGALNPAREVRRISVESFADRLGEVDVKQRGAFVELLQTADLALNRFKVRAELRRFEPESLPVLHIASKAALFQRSADQARESVSGLWAGILDSVASGASDGYGELCLNASNPLIQRLAELARKKRSIASVLEVLYVQALLLGRCSLRRAELAVLNEGVLALVNRAVAMDETEEMK